MVILATEETEEELGSRPLPLCFSVTVTRLWGSGASAEVSPGRQKEENRLQKTAGELSKATIL
jgi:hypothetical protein